MARFPEPQDPLFEALNSSIRFDFRLAPYDLEQSLAHARMLARSGIIEAADLAEIERGLEQVRDECNGDRFEVKPGDEDVHMAIERRLTELGAEIVIWSSEEFGFCEVADRFASGSSLMPQKKNPDAAELLRAKAPRVVGRLTTLHGCLLYTSPSPRDGL